MAVILVVEDDVFIRDLAEMMIQDCGHQNSSRQYHGYQSPSDHYQGEGRNSHHELQFRKTCNLF